MTNFPIAVIGAGYVGLVTATCLAEFGFKVYCVDVDPTKIASLSEGKMPIYEEGLEALVKKHLASGNLSFIEGYDDALLAMIDVYFLAVGTPTKNSQGETELTYLRSAVESIYRTTKASHVTLVIKSTVPVGTNRELASHIASLSSDITTDIVSNPEFLREGRAVHDFFHPDRVVVGCESDAALGRMQTIYQSLIDNSVPFIHVKPETAELIKYASNAFLATKIAFINELADMCERTDADIDEVALGMGLDHRIGKDYLQAGPGFGGSCFPKDIASLSFVSKTLGVPSKVLEAVIESNHQRKVLLAERIVAALAEPKDARIAILGVTFKAETDDVRESPALDIMLHLVNAGVKLHIYDPMGMDHAKKIIASDRVSWHTCPYEAATGTDASVILTEWDEFKNLDLQKLSHVVGKPHLFDYRNVLDASLAQEFGFQYHAIGHAPAQEVAVFEEEVV